VASVYGTAGAVAHAHTIESTINKDPPPSRAAPGGAQAAGQDNSRES
jgi:hypothetical protein